MHIGAIPSTLKPQWALAATLKNIEEYDVFHMKKTETLILWWYGIQALLWMNEEEIESVKDVVSLEDVLSG